MTRVRHDLPQEWLPWDEEDGRGPAGRLREGRNPAWLLSAVTVTVLAGGYGWLGSVMAGLAGAGVGGLVGLAVSGLLHVLVHRAVYGPTSTRPSPAPKDDAQAAARTVLSGRARARAKSGDGPEHRARICITRSCPADRCQPAQPSGQGPGRCHLLRVDDDVEPARE